jgi:hypothetical protein
MHNWSFRTRRVAVEIRRIWRDKKEVGLVIGVALCAIVYVVLALTVRGFV